MAKKEGDRSDLLTKEEMNRLMTVVSTDVYYSTLYNILLHTGRRIGEIYGTYRGKELHGGIKVNDIDFANKTITTIILKTKKRKSERYCFKCNTKNTHKNSFCSGCGNKLEEIDPEKLKYSIENKKTITLKDNALILLQNYIKGKNKKQYLFREVSLKTVQKKIKQHAELAGIKKNFSLHGFRHYFVTQCKRAGLTNEQIALWTGHIRPETLNIYSRMVPKDIESKINEVEL